MYYALNFLKINYNLNLLIKLLRKILFRLKITFKMIKHKNNLNQYCKMLIAFNTYIKTKL